MLRSPGPGERCAGLVVVLDELQQELLEFALGAVDALRQALPTENTAKAFHQVDPGSVGGRVIKMHSGMAPEPSASRLVFVDVPIVQNSVQVAFGEDGCHLLTGSAGNSQTCGAV